MRKKLLIALVSWLLRPSIGAAQTDEVKFFLMPDSSISLPLDQIDSITFNVDKVRSYVMRSHLKFSYPGLDVSLPSIDLLHFTSRSKVGDHRLISIVPVRTLAIKDLDSVTFPFYTIDTNVLLVGNFNPSGGLVKAPVWRGNTIYESGELRAARLNSDLGVAQSSFLGLSFETKGIDATNDGRRLLIESRKEIGEYDASKFTYTRLIEDTLLSGVRYMPNDSDFVYYSFGVTPSANNSANAGYYLFHRATGKSELLVAFKAYLTDGINGFDVSPDGSILLIPTVVQNEPRFLEYDIALSRSSYLPYSFVSGSGTRKILWGRYSKDGSQLLYCNASYQAFAAGSVADESEIGVINRQTEEKKVLSTAPSDNARWVGLFPDWSPDESMIVLENIQLNKEPQDWIEYPRLSIVKLKN